MLDSKGILSRKEVTHLLRRLTFGPTEELIRKFEGKDATYCVNQLLSDFTMPHVPPNRPANPRGYQNWTKGLMYHCDNALERLVFFLHTVFPSKPSTIERYWDSHYQLQKFRLYLVNDINDTNPKYNRYNQLVKKICVDTNMVIFLNGGANKKQHPNENLARELLELFTLGRGEEGAPNYTEADVREVARVLTGWTPAHTSHWSKTVKNDPDTGFPDIRPKEHPRTGHAFNHDEGVKTFRGKTIQPKGGRANRESMLDEIDQLVNIIYQQDAAATFLVRKLYRFFIHHDITAEAEQSVIAPLAQDFRDSNFRLRPVLLRLFSSKHFFTGQEGNSADDKFGVMVKSPLDLIVGTLRYFRYSGFKIPTTPLNKDFPYFTNIKGVTQGMNFSYLNPLDVAGYPPYHQEPKYSFNWMTTNSIATRYSWIQKLLRYNNWHKWGRDSSPQLVLNPLDWLLETFPGEIDKIATEATEVEGEKLALKLVTFLAEKIFAGPISQKRLNYFASRHMNSVAAVGGDAFETWKFHWQHKDSKTRDEVVGELEALFDAMLQTPEYQMF